jgi:hypothetical protein
MVGIRRRDFISALGSAAAWPLAVRAQPQPKLRVGFVGIQPRESPVYQEGRNLTFDYIQTPDVEGYEKKLSRARGAQS